MENNLYALLQWPDWHEYESEPWFEEEAIFSDESSYFIPLTRMDNKSIYEQITKEIMVTKCCLTPNFSYLVIINDYTGTIEGSGNEVFCAECGKSSHKILMPEFKATHKHNNGDELQEVNKNHVRILFSGEKLPTKLLEVYHCDEKGAFVEFNNEEICLNRFCKIVK